MANLFWQSYKEKDSIVGMKVSLHVSSWSLKGTNPLAAGRHRSYLVSLVTVLKEVIQLLDYMTVLFYSSRNLELRNKVYCIPLSTSTVTTSWVYKHEGNYTLKGTFFSHCSDIIPTWQTWLPWLAYERKKSKLYTKCESVCSKEAICSTNLHAD